MARSSRHRVTVEESPASERRRDVGLPDRIVVPDGPGWLWLAGVVVVSVALWAVVIWLGMQLVEWATSG